MKKFSRKIAAAAALAITVSSCMTGCFNNTGSGSGSGSSGGNSETVLRVGYTQEPSSFDPADFTIVAATLTGYDCYDTLLNFSHDGTKVEPALAESWEQVDDTTYTYKIRQGVKFSDGNEMTMDDVLYSLNRVTEDNYYMSYLFANVDSFEADNDTWTLTVHLKQPDSSWQYVPATSACTIVEKSVTEEQGDKYGTADGKTVGTGPYKLSSWSSGSEIVLERTKTGGATLILSISTR